jgi:hypothetical protein
MLKLELIGLTKTGIFVDLQIKKYPFKIVVLHTFSAKDP